LARTLTTLSQPLAGGFQFAELKFSTAPGPRHVFGDVTVIGRGGRGWLPAAVASTGTLSRTTVKATNTRAGTRCPNRSLALTRVR
jgi:hypothetical protein